MKLKWLIVFSFLLSFHLLLQKPAKALDPGACALCMFSGGIDVFSCSLCAGNAPGKSKGNGAVTVGVPSGQRAAVIELKRALVEAVTFTPEGCAVHFKKSETAPQNPSDVSGEKKNKTLLLVDGRVSDFESVFGKIPTELPVEEGGEGSEVPDNSSNNFGNTDPGKGGGGNFGLGGGGSQMIGANQAVNPPIQEKPQGPYVDLQSNPMGGSFCEALLKAMTLEIPVQVKMRGDFFIEEVSLRQQKPLAVLNNRLLTPTGDSMVHPSSRQEALQQGNPQLSIDPDDLPH